MATQNELANATILKLISFLFWGWSYIWCSQAIPRRDPEWYSRVVTLLHGSVATLAGLKQCNIMSLTPYKLTMKITIAHFALMLWSWGYFAFDLLWCLIYCPNNCVMLFHHAVALLGVNIYMGKDYTGCTFACTLALMEITNPLLQTRWFLREGGYGQSVPYYVVEFAYLFTFISLRGGLCTYLVFKILQSDAFDMDEKLISVALYVVSLALVLEVLGYVIYKYKGNTAGFRGYANEINGVFNQNR